MNPAEKPPWDPAAPRASLRRWTDHLHEQAKAAFLEHGTQTHVLFYFARDAGVFAVVPVPSRTSAETVISTIRKAIKERCLYAVVSMSEAWVYLHKSERDHVARQIRDGEMNVGDLRVEDKSEHLYVRMESQDGECVVIMDAIIRDGGRPALGESMRLEDEEMRWFAGK